MTPTPESSHAAPAPWRSRWYSAAKRFGIATPASIVLTVLGLCVGIGGVIFMILPIIAAVWGFVSPAPYGERPTVGNRIGVAALGLLGLLFLAGVLLFFWMALAMFHGTDARLQADIFDRSAAPRWSVLLACTPEGARNVRWEGNGSSFGGHETLCCETTEDAFLALAEEKGIELRRDDRTFNANTNTAWMTPPDPVPPDAPPPERFWFHAWIQSNCGGRYLLFDIDRGVLYGKYSSN